MNDLPPAGSTLWLSHGEEFPLLAAIGGILGIIAIWRWIAAHAEDSPS